MALMMKSYLRATFAGLAMGFMAAHGAAADGAPLKSNTSLQQADTQNAALTQTLCAAKYTVIGDTNHASTAITGALASDAFISGATACGVKHLFLEIGHNTQALVDDLAEKRISREDFATQKAGSDADLLGDGPAAIKQKWLGYADLIARAAEAGVKIHAADFGNGADEIIRGVMLYQMGFDAYKEFLPKEYHADIDALKSGKQTPNRRAIARLIEANQNHPAAREAQQLFAEGSALLKKGQALRTDDSILRDYVRDTMKSESDARGVIVIGNHHATSKTGIYNLLGDEARWIVMIGSKPWDTEAAHGRAPDLVVDVSSFEGRARFKAAPGPALQ
jgi:hypothetical protein